MRVLLYTYLLLQNDNIILRRKRFVFINVRAQQITVAYVFLTAAREHE